MSQPQPTNQHTARTNRAIVRVSDPFPFPFPSIMALAVKASHLHLQRAWLHAAWPAHRLASCSAGAPIGPSIPA